MGYPIAYTQYGGEPSPRAGVRHATVVPYGSYACGDGEAVNLAVQTERHWSRFCNEVCERPEWTADERYATSTGRRQHRAELEAGIEAAFAAHPRAEIARRLDAADIPFGESREIADFITHPQLEARDRWQTVDSPAGPLRAIVPPLDLEGMPPRMGAIPDVGEQTDEILAELGYDPAAIAGLRQAGAV